MNTDYKVTVTEKYGHFFIRRWRVIVQHRISDTTTLSLSGSAFTFSGAGRLAERFVLEFEA